MKRIPLDIVVTETGAATSGVVVAVMAAELDELEAENKRFSNRLVTTRTALTLIANDAEGFERARNTASKALKA